MTPKALCGIEGPTELSTITAAILSVLAIITTGGNILIIIAVWKNPYKKLKTSFMYVLVNLAVSDLIVGTVTLPTTVVKLILEALHHGNVILPHVSRLSFFVSATASILNLVALFIDRYFAVRKPVKYRQYSKFKNCLMVSFVIWVVAISVSMIYLKVGYIGYLMIFTNTSVIMALVLLTFVYFGVHKSLKKSTERSSKIGNGVATHVKIKTTQGESKRRYTNRKLTRVFLTILISFMACYAPVIIITYILKLCLQCSCVLRHVLRDMQYIFCVANAAVNPFVCTIQLTPFRKALTAIFRRESTRERADIDDNISSVVVPSCDIASASGAYHSPIIEYKKQHCKCLNTF